MAKPAVGVFPPGDRMLQRWNVFDLAHPARYNKRPLTNVRSCLSWRLRIPERLTRPVRGFTLTVFAPAVRSAVPSSAAVPLPVLLLTLFLLNLLAKLAQSHSAPVASAAARRSPRPLHPTHPR